MHIVPRASQQGCTSSYIKPPWSQRPASYQIISTTGPAVLRTACQLKHFGMNRNPLLACTTRMGRSDSDQPLDTKAQFARRDPLPRAVEREKSTTDPTKKDYPRPDLQPGGSRLGDKTCRQSMKGTSIIACVGHDCWCQVAGRKSLHRRGSNAGNTEREREYIRRP